jgi:alkylation response protein AidB-like acyl-CoA dehydrogenase
MHIDYSAEEQALRTELRQYFAALMTDDVRRALGEGVAETPTYREVVSRLGRDGWLGFGWPTEYGGRGESAREQYVFFEEAQRAGVPVPLVTLNTVGPTLIRFGTDEQRRRFLPAILRGDVHFAIGYTEPEAGTDLAALTTRAVRDGDGYVVTGQKVFTTGGHDADFIWLAVRTDPDAPKHRGLSILIVDCQDPGFSSSPMWTMGRGRLSATYYDQVRVPASMLVGEENGGWRLLTAQLNHERVALAALGGRAFGLFDDTLRWARTERLGDGGLLIDRPRVRAQFARLHARLEAMRLLNWRVMCDMDDGQIAPASAAAVKVYGTEMMIEACRTLLDITGPAGAYREGSSGAVMAGSLERAYRAAPVNTFGGGSNEVMRELIALGLGLPRTQR